MNHRLFILISTIIILVNCNWVYGQNHEIAIIWTRVLPSYLVDTSIVLTSNQVTFYFDRNKVLEIIQLHKDYYQDSEDRYNSSILSQFITNNNHKITFEKIEDRDKPNESDQFLYCSWIFSSMLCDLLPYVDYLIFDKPNHQFVKKVSFVSITDSDKYSSTNYHAYLINENIELIMCYPITTDDYMMK
jgi:hypothetical protein